MLIHYKIAVVCWCSSAFYLGLSFLAPSGRERGRLETEDGLSSIGEDYLDPSFG
jgi:hypothetical protein